MTDSKHTPGPWIWGKNHNGLYGAGPDNEVLAFADYEGMWLSYNNQKANAALIAASPDLLTAAKAVVDLFNYRGEDATDFAAHVEKLLKEAIAKAEA